jgi:hypothetical protein
MSLQAALLPLFVQVLLTFFVGFWLGWLRGVDLRDRVVRPSQIALREPNWSPRAMQASYSFSNQFELPVLFYVLTILVVLTRKADLIFVLLAWIFVVTRMFHALVHVTSNNVRVRGGIYGVGALVLFIMWVIFIIRILVAD